jgi:hypothetical protein
METNHRRYEATRRALILPGTRDHSRRVPDNVAFAGERLLPIHGIRRILSLTSTAKIIVGSLSFFGVDSLAYRES